MKIRTLESQRYDPTRLNWNSDNPAEQMLVRQFQFPEEYDQEIDELHRADSDRCFAADPDHFNKAPMFGGQTCGLEPKIMSARNHDVMQYVKHQISCTLTGAFRSRLLATKFTGFRVMVTLNKMNGYPYYTFELYKNKSGAKVSSAIGERRTTKITPDTE